MKKTLIWSAAACSLAGLALSFGLQLAGGEGQMLARPPVLARLYELSGALAAGAWLWLACSAGLLIYLFFSGALPRGCLKAAGFRPGGDGSPEARALTFSFGLLLALLAAGAAVSALRVNVYGGYACEDKPAVNCTVRQGTLRMIYLPGLARPGSSPRSQAVEPRDGGDMVRFAAASPAVGGDSAWPLAGLFLAGLITARAALAWQRRGLPRD